MLELDSEREPCNILIIRNTSRHELVSIGKRVIAEALPLSTFWRARHNENYTFRTIHDYLALSALPFSIFFHECCPAFVALFGIINAAR